MNISKLLRPFLKLTSEHEKFPTDLELDSQISYVTELLHHLSPLLRRIVRTKIKLFFQYRWKYVAERLIVLGVIVTLGYFALTTFTPVQITTHQSEREVVVVKYKSDSSMNLKNFLKQIAYSESRYDKTANRDGSEFWGLYQLGNQARIDGGMGDVPKDVFLNHQEIQDLCMVNYLKVKKKELRQYINKYDGKIIDGILITESGILSLAHLGSGYAKCCLDNGKIPETDENSNRPRDRAKIGGYDLNLDKVQYSIND